MKYLSLSRVLGGCCFIFAFYLASYYLLFCERLASIPGPVLGQENAFLLTTEFILKGGNPYRVESLPRYAEIYGPFYPLLLSCFAYLWGCTFFLHRWISVLFLGLSCILVFLFCRECAIERRFSFLGALLYFILFANSYSLAARPDTLGCFLLLLGMYVPLKNHFSKWSLGVSILWGILAFLTKPYFIFSILCVSVYLFLVESKKKAFLYFGSFFSILIAVVAIIQWIAPYYLESTFLVHLSYQSSKFSWLLSQLKDFSILHSGILFFTWIALIHCKRREGFVWFSPKKIAQKNTALSFITVSLGCAFLVLFGFMGWHVGAYLIYFFHLLTPFLMIYMLYFLQHSIKHPPLFILGLICFLLNLGILEHQKLKLPEVEKEKYVFFENLFASQKQILASPLFAHLYAKNGNLFYDNGHTAYFFHLVLMKNQYFSQEIQSKVFSYLQELDQKIQKVEFDFILIEKNDLSNFFVPRYFLQNYSSLLKSKYVLSQNIKFPCYYFDFQKRYKYGKMPAIIELWIRKTE